MVPKSAAKSGGDKTPSIEELFAQIDELVHSLENEQTPLEQMVGQFSKAVELYAQAKKQLEHARVQVEDILARLNQQGDETGADTPAVDA
ncbi:MAG TPA: exodeoxyribonuclease VII small subunit [Thermotogota bacterium]|nr:exodeoxyribonuclease VII small subunit [Thermotogota bacterium]HRW92964.1 exodeoxyribonuclease VII small subunit [Thermotogota bacterium]